jgi:hypothetical protein
MARSERDWINTFTGRKFWPLDPHPNDIDIVDIAHALAMQCRFTGHVQHFYSVAEHSVRVARRSPPEFQLWGLLHDAAEAYLVDLARPVKHQAALEGYRDAETRIMAAIKEKFGLVGDQPQVVHEIDGRMLITEATELLTMHPDWSAWADLGEPWLGEGRLGWSPAKAKRRFLAAFKSYREPRYTGVSST